MKKMNNKGFSLIELIIVIAIMAVLVAIIAPNLTKYLGSSKEKTDAKNIDEIVSQVKNCISDATIEDVQVVTGSYKITGSTLTSSPTSGGTFGNLILTALDGSATQSKVDTSKKSIQIDIKAVSGGTGYTVSAGFVK